MQVVAVSTPQKDAGWRWRIVNYAGEVVEESLERFPTIARAIEHGSKRLRQVDVVDRPRPYRWKRHLRVP
jgi:hypothetical protein